MACLHGKGIVHRDIKPSNVFLDLDGSVKLGDLGVAAEAGGADVLRGRVGTPLYLSPEQARGGEHGLAADVWSAGCVLYCVCAGRPPFVGATVGRVCRSIVRSEVPPLPAQYSAALRSTVRSMLRKAPAARPTPAQVRGTGLMWVWDRWIWLHANAAMRDSCVPSCSSPSPRVFERRCLVPPPPPQCPLALAAGAQASARGPHAWTRAGPTADARAAPLSRQCGWAAPQLHGVYASVVEARCPTAATGW